MIQYRLMKALIPAGYLQVSRSTSAIAGGVKENGAVFVAPF